MSRKEEIIEQLELIPHPEGGYYKETYRSEEVFDGASTIQKYGAPRNASTAIYFLLTQGNFSAFHKVKQDEFWHFYDGAPINLHIITPEGAYSLIKIGRNFSQGEVPQYYVPGGYWFASEVAEGGEFSLAGCTVSPGFDFADFELPSREKMTTLFPQHREIIERLTR